MITVDRLDHCVLTVHNIELAMRFYVDVLGMKAVLFADGRKAVQFGNQKINLHQYGDEFEPKAETALPGTADLCFVTQTPMDDVVAHLKEAKVHVVHGPVLQTGAIGQISSIYFRDPDMNLIEISNYL